MTEIYKVLSNEFILPVQLPPLPPDIGSISIEEDLEYENLISVPEYILSQCPVVIKAGGKSLTLFKNKHKCKDGKTRNVYKMKGHGNVQFVKTKGKLVKLSDVKK